MFGRVVSRLLLRINAVSKKNVLGRRAVEGLTTTETSWLRPL